MWGDQFEILFADAKCWTVAAGVGMELKGSVGSALITGELGTRKASTLDANRPSSYACPSRGRAGLFQRNSQIIRLNKASQRQVDAPPTNDDEYLCPAQSTSPALLEFTAPPAEMQKARPTKGQLTATANWLQITRPLKGQSIAPGSRLRANNMQQRSF